MPTLFPWSHLPDESKPDETFQRFVDTLCELNQEIELAALFRPGLKGQVDVLARFPKIGVSVEPLLSSCERVINEDCGLVYRVGENQPFKQANYLVGYPIKSENTLVAVLVAAVHAENEDYLNNLMGHIEWAAPVIQQVFLQRTLTQHRHQSSSANIANQLLADVLSYPDFNEAINVLLVEIARHYQCQRASFGLRHKQRFRLLALSNLADFNNRVELIRQIEMAMAETGEQVQPLVFPPLRQSDDLLIAHKLLSEKHGNMAVLSVPILDYRSNEVFAVVTLERQGGQAFTLQEVQQINSLLALSGNTLLDKWRAEQSLWLHLKRALKRQLEHLLGPGHTKRKVVAIVALLLTILFSTVKGEYWLSSEAWLQASEQMRISAPFSGYLEKSIKKAGDRIGSDDVLAQMETREIELELTRQQSKMIELQSRYAEQLSVLDRAKMAALKYQMEQTRSDIELAELNLKRASIRSAMPGLIIEGDLTQQIGEPLKQGEKLFVVADTSNFLVMIEVDESRILDIKSGQKGKIVFHSMPDESWAIELVRLSPVHQYRQGKNFYLAESRLLQPDVKLKPGLRGVAKLYIDERNLFSIWIRDTRQWLTLLWWRLFGR